MCSIAGGKEGVKEMLNEMSHRSPQGYNVRGEGFQIGMGRLAVIDTESDGLFPYEEDGKILAFNGEIYNYQELKQELIYKGHRFKTQSDTEVLMKSYKEWGVDCLDHLNGMFAFAIKDGALIFLARDIAGEKPLYYQEHPFRFASEAKAFDFECIEFPPASYGIYTPRKGLEIHRWWFPKKVDIKDPEKELEALLEDSVRLRTRSDVPYGLYYSGGVDSSLIASFHDFENVYTYHEGNDKEEFLKIFPKILYHLDGPIDSFSPFGLWKLAQKASKEVRVVLSGEGADELFGGYVRYVPNEFNRLAQEKFPSYKALFPYRDMMLEEFHGNMRELLRMGDRMAAAWGLENRCPFLDRRIIEFAFSLPMEWKIKGFETKVILRNILKKRVPEYQFEEKHGLYVPVNKYLGVSHETFSKEEYRKYQQKLWSTRPSYL